MLRWSNWLVYDLRTGGAGITYRIQIRTRTPTQPLVLERDDFMHNLSPGKKTMLHGRIHYFFESWDDVRLAGPAGQSLALS